MTKNVIFKYSILLPSKNGFHYISSCIDSIVEQNFDDYELVISDDSSQDGSFEFFQGLKSKHVRLVSPPCGLSMTEHWEWLLGQAKGRWILFIGQDDGLQPYFFELAEGLTEYATKKGIRSIVSQRSYYFWPGCEKVYGELSVRYLAIPTIKIFDTSYKAVLGLLGFEPYFNFPQMYTSSIFNRELLVEATARQGGKLFTTHPQDANLAAIALNFEKKYLFSGIPLGWVGTSPRSAGYAVTQDGDNHAETNRLRFEYLSKIDESKYRYHEMAGDFRISSMVLYWYGAYLSVSEAAEKDITKLLRSRVAMRVIYSAALAELWRYKFSATQLQYSLFFDLVKKYNINRYQIYSCAIAFYIMGILLKMFENFNKILSLAINNGILINITNCQCNGFNFYEIREFFKSKKLISKIFIKLKY